MEHRTEDLAAQPYAFIRMRTKKDEIGNNIGACLGRIAPFVGERCAGMPLARWSAWEGDGGVMEVGIPVRGKFEGEGDIQCGELPAGKAISVTHVGSYDGLAETWRKLGAWIKEQGIEARADPWESYVDDPGEVPVEKLRTVIYWPV